MASGATRPPDMPPDRQTAKSVAIPAHRQKFTRPPDRQKFIRLPDRYKFARPPDRQWSRQTAESVAKPPDRQYAACGMPPVRRQTVGVPPDCW